MSGEASTGRLLVAIAVATVSALSAVVAIVGRLAFDLTSDLGGWGVGLGFAAFGVVGAIIIARVPGNRLGWVFGVMGVILPITGFQELARPLYDAGVPLDLIILGQIGSDVAFTISIFSMVVFTPAWFPTGRPLTRRWGWFTIVGGVSLVAVISMTVLGPTVSLPSWGEIPLVAANPIGVNAIPISISGESSAYGVAILIALGMAVASITSLGVRFRRSDPVTRSQIRWLLSSVCLVVPVMIANVLVGEHVALSGSPLAAVADLALGAAFITLPLSAGIAITRYHLYDLGRIVRRTITYSVVAGCLGVLFAVGTIAIPQTIPGPDNGIGIAATTLIVAASFHPLRRRVQLFTDKRFHRLRYDSEQTVITLGSRIDGEVNETTIMEALQETAAAALLPAASGVWMRRE